MDFMVVLKLGIAALVLGRCLRHVPWFAALMDLPGAGCWPWCSAGWLSVRGSPGVFADHQPRLNYALMLAFFRRDGPLAATMAE